MLFPCVALSVEFAASSQQKGRVSLRTAVSDVYRTALEQSIFQEERKMKAWARRDWDSEHG